jgi:hypothetical protein
MDYGDDDDDAISNITFSGDESNRSCSRRKWETRKKYEEPIICASTIQNPCCKAKVESTAGKTAKVQKRERLQQKRRTGHLKVQQDKTNILKNCRLLSVHPQTHETLRRATAAAALANEAQKLAQLRAQARLEEERNKPCYKGGTRLRRRKNNNNNKTETLQRKSKPPWDNSIQPMVGEGTLKIRNRKECNATVLVERQQRQLALRLKALEREEALHLEEKQSLEARRAKSSMSSTIKIRKCNKEVEPKHRQELEMQDRCDGQVERTYTETKVKITPSKSNAFVCFTCQTRSTSPFDDQIVAKLLALDSSDGDPTKAAEASQNDMQEELQMKQMQLLKGIERQLMQLRLLDEEVNEGFGFKVPNYCNEKLTKNRNVEHNLSASNMPVAEAINETDAVSVITTQPLLESFYDSPAHPSQEEYFYCQLKQYIDHKKFSENRGDGHAELQSSKIIEL